MLRQFTSRKESWVKKLKSVFKTSVANDIDAEKLYGELCEERQQVIFWLMCRGMEGIANSPQGFTAELMIDTLGRDMVLTPGIKAVLASPLTSIIAEGEVNHNTFNHCFRTYQQLVQIEKQREEYTHIFTEVITSSSPSTCAIIGEIPLAAPCLRFPFTNTREQSINNLYTAIIACGARQSFNLLISKQLAAMKDYSELFASLIQLGHVHLIQVLLEKGVSPDTCITNNTRETLSLLSSVYNEYMLYFVRIMTLEKKVNEYEGMDDAVKLKLLEDLNGQHQLKIQQATDIVKLLISFNADPDLGEPSPRLLASESLKVFEANTMFKPGQKELFELTAKAESRKTQKLEI